MQSINASSMHLQCFNNASSMHSLTHHQCIVSAVVNASSMHLSIYHQCIIASTASISFIQLFLSFIKFIQISSFALLFGHSLLCCCHPFRLSSFLFKFTLPVQFIFQSFIPVRSPFVLVFSYLLLYYFCASLILDLIPYPLGRYLAVLIHNFMLWRKNPQCSATCCITMLLSLNELTSGVNSVASMRKTNFRTNLGMGGVDMPSMRSAVNDNVGFEIEDKEEDIKSKKDKVTDTRGVRFTDAKGPTDEMLSNNIIRRGIPEGRRFSCRFPARQIGALNS